MTVQERINELVQGGAAIQVYPPGHEPLPPLLLARCTLASNPTRFRWAAIYPEDQHHFHATPYKDAALAAKGRDVALYAADGSMAAYICPYDEGSFDADAAQDALDKWRQHCGTPPHQDIFDQEFEANA